MLNHSQPEHTQKKLIFKSIQQSVKWLFLVSRSRLIFYKASKVILYIYEIAHSCLPVNTRLYMLKYCWHPSVNSFYMRFMKNGSNSIRLERFNKKLCQKTVFKLHQPFKSTCPNSKNIFKINFHSTSRFRSCDQNLILTRNTVGEEPKYSAHLNLDYQMLLRYP